MSTIQEALPEFKKLEGTLVLDMFEVVLFHKIVEEPDDFYYVLQREREEHCYLLSCVGRIIPLVQRLNKEEYEYIVSVWNLNATSTAR